MLEQDGCDLGHIPITRICLVVGLKNFVVDKVPMGYNSFRMLFTSSVELGNDIKKPLIVPEGYLVDLEPTSNQENINTAPRPCKDRGQLYLAPTRSERASVRAFGWCHETVELGACIATLLQVGTPLPISHLWFSDLSFFQLELSDQKFI